MRPADLRYTIYEREVQAMASEYSKVLVRAMFLRVADPRSGVKPLRRPFTFDKTGS
jgi:hypothetical protein